MLLPTHFIAGLIIGKLTGNYPASLIGSMAIDLDHVISYFKHGILFKPKKLAVAMMERRDPRGDHRFLHNVFSWAAISILVLILDKGIGLIFGFAYLAHLVLDALNNADLFPLFPINKINLRKPIIKYFSIQELIFTSFLLLVFFIL